MGSAFHKRNTKGEISNKDSQDLHKWLKRNVSGDEFKNWFHHDPNPRYTAMKKLEQELKNFELEK